MTFAADPGRPLDWGEIIRFLLAGDNHPDGRSGPALRPWEILRLTMAEIAWLMSESGRSLPGGGQRMSDAQIVAYAEWYRGPQPLEKLELAREGKLL